MELQLLIDQIDLIRLIIPLYSVYCCKLLIVSNL